MRILICNERFVFRYGVDRVLLLLGRFWKEAGHEIILMGNRFEETSVHSAHRMIRIPISAEYEKSNEETLRFLKENWNQWFQPSSSPDAVLVAGWPFYLSIPFFSGKTGAVIFYDFGAVPMEGMTRRNRAFQVILRKMRASQIRYADRVIAISRFLEETQSRKDAGDGVPTDHVLLGTDHMRLQLWKGGGNQELIRQIRAWKEQGDAVLLQPGRWEKGNYKNSAAGMEVVRRLRKDGKGVHLLVLAQKQEMDDLPEDVADAYVCMGHVDDATLNRVMELSDLGFSPSLWEGFDLPLGEMQVLGKSMYVLKTGAHEEVAAHPWYLCGDMAEMAEKISMDLRDQLPVSREELRRAREAANEKLTWKNCSEEMIRQIRLTTERSICFVDVSNACRDPANSGVMKVTRKVSRALQCLGECVFVLWEDAEYVFPCEEELSRLCSFGGPVREQIHERSESGKERRRLNQELNRWQFRRKVFFLTETLDASSMARKIRYLHAGDFFVASIFHDAIPVLRPELCSPQVAANHGAYMAGLADCDLVLATARHNQDDLEAYWERQGIRHGHAATSVLGVDTENLVYRQKDLQEPEDGLCRVLFVSTLEPRKNHIRFLQAYEMWSRAHSEWVSRVQVTLVGNRYASREDIAETVRSFCRTHPQVQWLGVVDDATLTRLYRECTFTVYPSEIEGYGIPIIESAIFGKPCLCNGEGSIGELAAGGGCLTVNVLDVPGMAEAFHRMVSDRALRGRLTEEAEKRRIISWKDYAGDLLEQVRRHRTEDSGFRYDFLSPEHRMKLLSYLTDAGQERIVFLSNFYPPNIQGGAEVIAHEQARVFQRQGHDVLVLSVEPVPSLPGERCRMQEVDGIPVMRFRILQSHMHADSMYFFDREINTWAREVFHVVRPDIVLGHNLAGMSLGILDAAEETGARIAVTLHDNWGFCPKNTLLDQNGKVCRDYHGCRGCAPEVAGDGYRICHALRDAYIRRMLGRADWLIAPSRYIARSYIRAGYAPEQIAVIPNGIDTERFSRVSRIPSERIRISFFGYFGVHKGVETLIRALSLLKDPRVEAELIGSGQREDAYRTLAEQCGVAGQIRFWGRIPNHEIEKGYAETDILCLPSIWPENQPVSICEAMACGIPVIASDLGGNAELVEHGVTGYLFRAGDEEDLAEKIRCFLREPEQMKVMGRRGQDAIREKSFEVQGCRILEKLRGGPGWKRIPEDLILWKGRYVPEEIGRLRRETILLMDWIMDDGEWTRVRLCVLDEGPALTFHEQRMIQEYGISLLVPQRMVHLYPGLRLLPYADVQDLYLKLAGWKRTED